MEKTTQFSLFLVKFKHLEGELLTIIDASFPDIKQREAVKSMVRRTLWDMANKIHVTVFPSNKYDQKLQITGAHGGGKNIGAVVDSTK